MSRVLLLAGAALLLAVPTLADEKKEMEFKGTLQTGIVAIGGETTGTIITTEKKETYEVEFGKNKELRAQAEKLNKKMVVVVGTLEVKKGVEVKERRIITVTSLKAAE